MCPTCAQFCCSSPSSPTQRPCLAVLASCRAPPPPKAAAIALSSPSPSPSPSQSTAASIPLWEDLLGGQKKVDTAIVAATTALANVAVQKVGAAAAAVVVAASLAAAAFQANSEPRKAPIPCIVRAAAAGLAIAAAQAHLTPPPRYALTCLAAGAACAAVFVQLYLSQCSGKCHSWFAATVRLGGPGRTGVVWVTRRATTPRRQVEHLAKFRPPDPLQVVLELAVFDCSRKVCGDVGVGGPLRQAIVKGYRERAERLREMRRKSLSFATSLKWLSTSLGRSWGGNRSGPASRTLKQGG